MTLLSKQIITLFLSMLFSNCQDQVKLTSVERVPFRLINDIIYVKLAVNGRDDLNFIFDTGAGMTLISPDLGQTLGLQNGGSFRNTGAAGSSQVQTYTNNEVKIGNIFVNNVSLSVSGTKLKGAVLHEELHGVIGFDLLSKFVVKINYDAAVLEFHNFHDFKYTGDGKRLKFNTFSNVPYIETEVVIDGKRFQGDFLVDSGAGAHILLNAPFVRENDVINKVGNYFALSIDVGTSKAETQFVVSRIPEATLAGHSFTNIPAILSQAKNGVLSIGRFHGIIGNSLLKRFNTTYDYQRNMMYMESNYFMDKSFEVDCLGVVFDKELLEGKLLIKRVIEGSPAAQAGLQELDQIITIDRKSIEDINSSWLRKILNSPDSTVIIHYERDGETDTKAIKLRQLI